MKKLLKIIAIAAVFVLGIQNTTAQSLNANQDRPETTAKQKTAELSKELSLDGNQQRYVFRALTTHEVETRKNVDGQDINSPEVIAIKAKIDASLDRLMKYTLTEEQFTAWKAMQK
ncbi:hypothetical protein N9Y36_02465 [Ulvibacter sp.]|nr:hypothetical protein [Ulvibacter sp.]